MKRETGVIMSTRQGTPKSASIPPEARKIPGTDAFSQPSQ